MKAVIVQHSFGDVGSGGPIGALERLLASDLSDEFDFRRMHQPGPLGGLDLALLRDWASYLRRLRPQLVHVRGLGNEGFHAASAARAAGVEHVLVSIHGTHRDLAMPSGAAGLRSLVVRRALEPATLKLAHHVATVCEYAAKRPFVARADRKFVGVVPNGVDFPARAVGPTSRPILSQFGIGQGDKVLIAVSRVTKEKGLLDLAQAMRRMTDGPHGAVLVVVGDGPDRLEIEHAFLRIPHLRTVFVGRRTDVPQLLSEADIFVFPSWHENLSNALLEAMAAGLPVVATSVGGNTEVLAPDSGLLVPAREPDVLAAAVGRLVDDAELRRELGARARARIRDRYTVGHMVSGWGDVYRRLLGVAT